MHYRSNKPVLTHRHWIALGATLLLFVLSCAISSRSDAPPQSWWKERGPVVPHASFPADCSLCHEGAGWQTIRKDFVFDHEKETGVKLDGAHAQAECLRCHNDRGPVAMFAARGCDGCHENVHRGQLGDDCESCHTQTNWRPNQEILSHSRTRFPLVGAHAVAACWRCHPGAQTGNFARVDTTCVSCHREDLAGAANPDHIAQGWVDACDRCHIPTQWTGGGFTHASWPLVGQHAQALCADCHVGAVFSGTPNQCVDCHLAEYQNADDPDHVALNFSMQCQQCHNPSGWDGANFPHVGIVNGCVQCHLSDYQGANDPDHVAASFSQNCEECHTSTNNWGAVNFSHSGVTTGCSQCHMPEYQSTSSPNHVTAGFPTTCEQCHTSTSNWHQATFSHPQFPITSGDHNHFDCTDCHTTPNDFQAFSCTSCHEHNQQNAGGHHNGVQNYVWQSAACYQCHPDGQER